MSLQESVAKYSRLKGGGESLARAEADIIQIKNVLRTGKKKQISAKTKIKN